MLTCYFTRRKLGAWLDGALDAATGGVTAAHVEGCAACRTEAGQLRRLRQALRSGVAPADPDWTGFWPAIVRGIEAGRGEDAAPARASRPPLRWAFGGALAAALVLAVGVWQFALGPAESEAGVSVSHAVTDDPRGTIMIYAPPERDVAVVWVFDLD